jgi:hypothetical protein
MLQKIKVINSPYQEKCLLPFKMHWGVQGGFHHFPENETFVSDQWMLFMEMTLILKDRYYSIYTN